MIKVIVKFITVTKKNVTTVTVTEKKKVTLLLVYYQESNGNDITSTELLSIPSILLNHGITIYCWEKVT